MILDEADEVNEVDMQNERTNKLLQKSIAKRLI